jgi:predicted extracellular nuclease
MSSSRSALAVLASVATVVAGGALLGPANANPSSTGLVISEVYGAGGNGGAVFNADFVELYNPTASAVSLTGDYIHYRSASGTSGGTPYALTGSVPAGGHFLIQMGAAGGTGAALPTPDAVASPAFSLAAAGGQVYLLSSATPITTTGNQAGATGVVDMVGASGSTSFETEATQAAATATSSLNRAATGADTDNNHADFALAAPTPQNAGTGTPPPPPTDYTIAQIQGTDTDTSPHLGESVITRGVVTADYATGGFNGFYLQTAGTGGTTDATPGASDAIFVFGSAAAAKVHIGDFVEVQGTVSEFAGTTEIGATADHVTELSDAHDPVTPAAIAYPTTDAAREAHEGELLAPTNDFTVTDNFDLNAFGEIGLATGDHQLVQPTDVDHRPGRSHRRPGRQCPACGHARRRGQHQLPQRRQQGHPAPVADDRQPRPDRLAGDAARAGDPRVPQQPVGLPADLPGDRRRRRRRDVRRHARGQRGAAAGGR